MGAWWKQLDRLCVMHPDEVFYTAVEPTFASNHRIKKQTTNERMPGWRNELDSHKRVLPPRQGDTAPDVRQRHIGPLGVRRLAPVPALPSFGQRLHLPPDRGPDTARKGKSIWDCQVYHSYTATVTTQSIVKRCSKLREKQK